MTKKELAFDTVNEDGEVSKVFSTLKDYNDTSGVVIEEVQDKLKELYLHDEEEFKKLRQIIDKEVDDSDNLIITNDIIKDGIKKLQANYGSVTVFNALYSFFKYLASTTDTLKTNTSIFDLTLKEANYSLLDKIPDIPCIVTNKDEKVFINKSTLSMKIDPDLVKWDTIKPTSTNIMKIYLGNLLNYIYDQILVDQGVDTNHIRWCDNKYKLITPGGFVIVGMDRDKFMTLVRSEVIMNLLMANLNTIIALSYENIYIKPTRRINFSTLRLRLVTGKLIDLPVTVKIRNRPNYCGA